MGISVTQTKPRGPDIRINADKLYEHFDFVPHPGEQELLDSEERFLVWICGRRWGKSITAARWAEKSILLPGTRGWVVSETYDLTRKVIRVIYEDVVTNMMRPAGLELLAKQMSGPILLEFPWGSIVEGKSAKNVDSLMGEELDWLIIDEFCSSKVAAWEYYLRPTLTSRMGRCLFIGTPKGYNWGWDLYKRGMSDDPDWKSYKAPSWENPHLPAEDLEEARRTLSPIAFAQEYGADFTTHTGQVYKEFDETIHVVPAAELAAYIDPEWDKFRSIDFGYENPFVCVYITVDPEDRIIVYDEYVQRHTTVEQHAANLNEDGVDYEYSTCDPSGASPRATLLENGIPTVAIRSDVVQGLEGVRECLRLRDDEQPGFYISDRCVETLLEFNLYSYPERGDMEAPKKQHDHCMDAIRYFIVNWKRGYIKQYTGQYS